MKRMILCVDLIAVDCVLKCLKLRRSFWSIVVITIVKLQKATHFWTYLNGVFLATLLKQLRQISSGVLVASCLCIIEAYDALSVRTPSI